MNRKEALQAMKMNPAELARHCGVGLAAVSNWEHMENIPPQHELTIRKHLESTKKVKK
jgi:DNA-binding transcriptional regulator YiaG